MILSLKEIYKEKCLIDEMPEHPNDYFWFKDEENHLIGIDKAISLTEKKLISIMFDEVVAIDFDQHTRLLWLDLLLLGKTTILNQSSKNLKNVRLIFFNHDFNFETKLEFDSLIKQFDDQLMTLFIDSKYGVILDFNTDEHYTLKDLEEFVNAVQQDFYCSMTLYRTESYPLNETLSTFFSEEFANYQKYYNRHFLVMQQQDILLQYLIEKVDNHSFMRFRTDIKEVPYEQIEVVKCYLENNFNLSFGAKVLHMHRNTFMNRLERFIQTTGLNVKEFRDAMIAYLLIESLDSESKL